MNQALVPPPAESQRVGVLERLIFNHRPAVIGLCLLTSLLLFWQALQIRPSTSFEKMIPLSHPYIQNMLAHRNDLANLGNSLRIAVESTEGDIFQPGYMETLRQINDELFYLPGVDRAGLKSLWSPSVRWTEVTEEGFAGVKSSRQGMMARPQAWQGCMTTYSSRASSDGW